MKHCVSFLVNIRKTLKCYKTYHPMKFDGKHIVCICKYDLQSMICVKWKAKQKNKEGRNWPLSEFNS